MCEKQRAVFDPNTELADNALLRHRPELFYEWDFEKNDALGLDVYSIALYSNKKVWWLCPKCTSGYDCKIGNRAIGRNCPYCAGKKINHTNSLATKRPDLAKQWHPILNYTLTPNDVTCNMNKKVWWQCHLLHQYLATPNNRDNGFGCPYCANNKVLKGFNDMWTTNPELASLLADPEDGYKYTQMSSRKVDWRCGNCNERIEGKMIANTNKQGLSCPKCSDGTSYPEKFMYHLLKQLDIEFEWEKGFDWLPNRRYDFYLSDFNTVIEVHGAQHFRKGFETLGGNALSKVQQIDKNKEISAKENGIERYIVINASRSNHVFLKKQIVKSSLSEILDLNAIMWSEVHTSSLKSLVLEVCDLWNKGKRTKEIEVEMKLSRSTICDYLNKGTSAGICNYQGKNEKTKTCARVIVQLDLELSYIKEWNSMTEAAKHFQVDSSNFTGSCRDQSKTTCGFKWMYAEDYYKLKEVI